MNFEMDEHMKDFYFWIGESVHWLGIMHPPIPYIINSNNIKQYKFLAKRIGLDQDLYDTKKELHKAIYEKLKTYKQDDVKARYIIGLVPYTNKHNAIKYLKIILLNDLNQPDNPEPNDLISEINYVMGYLDYGKDSSNWLLIDNCKIDGKKYFGMELNNYFYNLLNEYLTRINLDLEILDAGFDGENALSITEIHNLNTILDNLQYKD